MCLFFRYSTYSDMRLSTSLLSLFLPLTSDISHSTPSPETGPAPSPPSHPIRLQISNHSHKSPRLSFPPQENKRRKPFRQVEKICYCGFCRHRSPTPLQHHTRIGLV
ncbi:hypothetical protein DL98DRAFT_98125 [Cadophora sp. DSE1049]|nr:hypothetical protein DL98DRAFT_98125 [Cadophora sp. DSE1049]